jgi:Ca-activated chloride channel family protein
VIDEVWYGEGVARKCRLFVAKPGVRNERLTDMPASALRLESGLRFRTAWGRTLRALFAVGVLIALSSFVRSQQSPSRKSPSSDQYTIKVNVDMVVLRATALDHKNTLVSGLDKVDFQVYEDGVLQTIKHFSHEDVPVTVGLVIDNSGSMSPKRHDVIAAAMAFARSSNPQDQMFVVNFNEKVSFGLPENMQFTDKVAQVELALARGVSAGETALYDAVVAALDHLKQGNREKKVLIVVSDGGDNASQHKLAEIIALAGQPNIIIYTIGIFDEQDADRNPRVLKQLAKDTGGEAFLPESLNDVAPICERIARDIRNQYTIAYIPTNHARDGRYRILQVKASAPGRGRLVVRTRIGYFAPSTSPAPPSVKGN